MTSPSAERVRRAAVTLAALSQNGLHYGVGAFDLDRYRKVGRIAAELLAVLTDRPEDELALELGRDSGYATPKVDVRGIVFDAEEKVLLIRERTDGFWSVPGGWADPGDTPTEAIIREIREESGYPARVRTLIACLDRDKQGHTPALPVHVYKLFFLCELDGPPGPPDELETLDVGWFALDDLPPLSQHRVHADQLELALLHHRDPSRPTVLD